MPVSREAQVQNKTKQQQKNASVTIYLLRILKPAIVQMEIYTIQFLCFQVNLHVRLGFPLSFAELAMAELTIFTETKLFFCFKKKIVLLAV